MKWLEKLTNRLATFANSKLDTMLQDDEFGAAVDAYRAKDFKAALKKYEALARGGHAQASTLAGTMYLMGDGCPKNGEKAVEFFQLGIKAGDPEATLMLGLTYAAGYGVVSVDFGKARMLLEPLANQGNKRALEMLAIMKAKQPGKRK